MILDINKIVIDDYWYDCAKPKYGDFVSLRPKMYCYLTDDGYVDKKAKGMKKCVIKCEIKYEDYNNCLENNEKLLRSNQSFKSETHFFMEKVSNIALSGNDDTRPQTLDAVVSYLYDTGAGRVCRAEFYMHLN